VSLPPSLADRLRYLADLGWEDLYRVPPTAVSAAEQVAATPAGDVAAAAPSNDAAARLEALADEASRCPACRLCETRNRVVFGTGHPRASLMFVGEAPGAEEDRQGLPFVGRAGELLDKMIRAIDLDREHVYIANVVKCRPPGNRDPQPDEVEACRRFLDGQIDAVAPALLVCLGRVAAQSLLGTDEPLGRMRGSVYQVRGVETRVTYHPAALLRNAALKRPAWEDLQQIRDRLRELTDGA
jgi:DNA polymerase